MSALANTAAEVTVLPIYRGNFYEDLVAAFKTGEVIQHATPRTITAGDVAAYNAIYGQRFAVSLDDEFARELGFERAPIPWMLLFHMGFGKTVPDVSQLAMANLGYSDVRLLQQVYPGDSLVAETEVIGYKENFSVDAQGNKTPKGTGNVYVQSKIYRVREVEVEKDVDGVKTMIKQKQKEPVMEFKRVVMVNKKDKNSKPTEVLGMKEDVIPSMPETIDTSALINIASRLPDMASANNDIGNVQRAGSPMGWEQYEKGMKINHGKRHEIKQNHVEAPNLYENTADVHFAEGKISADSSVVGTGIVYGGHVMCMADEQSYYGFENTVAMLGLLKGAHTTPCFEGETVAAWSEVVDKIEVPGRVDIGILLVRTVGAKNQPAGGFPDKVKVTKKGKDSWEYPKTSTTITIKGNKHVADAGVAIDFTRAIVVRRGLKDGRAPTPSRYEELVAKLTS